MLEKSDLGVGTCGKSPTWVLENVRKVRLRYWKMLEKSDMSVKDKLRQPGRLVLRHSVQISEFGDRFFCSVQASNLPFWESC
jgi:hypothetical protein